MRCAEFKRGGGASKLQTPREAQGCPTLDRPSAHEGSWEREAGTSLVNNVLRVIPSGRQRAMTERDDNRLSRPEEVSVRTAAGVGPQDRQDRTGENSAGGTEAGRGTRGLQGPGLSVREGGKAGKGRPGPPAQSTLKAELGSLKFCTSFCCKGRLELWSTDKCFRKITGDKLRLGWKEEDGQPGGGCHAPEQS